MSDMPAPFARRAAALGWAWAGIAALVLAAAGCATTGAGETVGVGPADMARALEGRWDNRVQFAAAPPALRVAAAPPAADAAWIDRQALVMTRVNAPAIATDVVYVEWRAGGPDGAPSRRSLWAFRRTAAGAVTLETYALRAPAAFAGNLPTAFARLTPADLEPPAPGCALAVAPRGEGAFDARVAPQSCRARTAAGRAFGLAVHITLMPTGLLYEEAGVYDDDSYAFRIPGGAPYDFRRP